MPQVKKTDKSNAILEAAFGLFSRKGYTATTMADIAQAANTTVANIYVYFPSKLVILAALYRPWLERQLQGLSDSVRKFRSPRTRLRRIFVGVWGDIPAADHCFANCLMEALAAAPERGGKPNDLLVWAEGFITDLVAEALPPARADMLADRLFAHVIWMAFDGFAINRRIGDVRDVDRIAGMMTDLLLGADDRNAVPARFRLTEARRKEECHSVLTERR